MDDSIEEHLPEVLEKFTAVGGRFFTPIADLRRKLDLCSAIVFDWDGVFNTGRKELGASSGFSEPDSMGTNMLRYGLWRKLGKLPYTAIISGETNETAIEFAKRERLTAVYTGFKTKQQIIAHLCGDHDLDPGQIACVFDDINDLPMAGLCGIRFMVRREASPLMADYVARRALCDYVTGADADAYAVREVCELLLGLMGTYDEVLDSRISHDDDYETYFKARQAVVTNCFGQQRDTIGVQRN